MTGLELDLHTHLVPGVDDGSRGGPETVAMARGLASLGVRRVHLTPHQYRFGNEFTPVDARAQAAQVRDLLARAGIALEVEAGAEYFYGSRLLAALERDEPLIATAVGPERCVLIELPFDRPVVGVRRLGTALRRRGLRPVLAHPERLGALLPPRARLDEWRRAGWQFQLNLLSLSGFHGEEPRAVASALLREGLVDHVGSDLHRPSDLDMLARAHETWRRLAPQRVEA